MDDERQDSLPEEPEVRYVPRPRWQVWTVRVGLVLFLLFLLFLAAYYINIARGGL